MRAWFYVDPQIADPKALTAMLAESAWPPMLKDGTESGFSAISSHHQRDIRLYALDALALAPFSVATAEQMVGQGILERLRSAEGASIIAFQKSIDMLRIYCKERLNRQFREIATHQTPSLTLRQVWCGVGE